MAVNQTINIVSN